MKLLIHGCCADCTLKLIKSIPKKDFEEINIFFYNPNIHPRSEYQSRLKAIQNILAEEKNIKLIIPDWKPSEYFESVKTNKKPERCCQCWSLRLKRTAKAAKENGFSHFSSTLVSSQYQNGDKVIAIGKKLAKEYDLIFYVPKNIDKNLETKGFYKQIFCGCTYSLTERFEEKFLQKDD